MELAATPLRTRRDRLGGVLALSLAIHAALLAWALSSRPAPLLDAGRQVISAKLVRRGVEHPRPLEEAPPAPDAPAMELPAPAPLPPPAAVASARPEPGPVAVPPPRAIPAPEQRGIPQGSDSATLLSADAVGDTPSPPGRPMTSARALGRSGLLRQMSALEPRLAPCSIRLTASPQSGAGGPVLMLDLELLAGAVRIVDAQVEEPGPQDAGLAACVQGALRDLTLPALGARPGGRHQLRFAIQR